MTRIITARWRDWSGEGLQHLVLAQGETQRAGRLLAATQGVWDALSLPPPPEIRVGYEQSVRIVRSQLDETNFHTTWPAGRAMTLEQAISYALAVE